MVARLLEDGSGPNIRPFALSWRLSRSRIDAGLDGDRARLEVEVEDPLQYFEKSITSAAPTVCPASDDPPPRGKIGTPWLAASSTAAGRVVGRLRDDDADRLDLVVRGVGRVEHAGGRSKRTSPRCARCRSFWSAAAAKGSAPFDPEPVAIGIDVTDAGLTGNRGGHVDIVLSRIGGAKRRHKSGESVGWARRPSVALTTLTPTPRPALILTPNPSGPHPNPSPSALGEGLLVPD